MKIYENVLLFGDIKYLEICKKCGISLCSIFDFSEGSLLYILKSNLDGRDLVIDTYEHYLIRKMCEKYKIKYLEG